jgi:hypothetical protein
MATAQDVALAIIDAAIASLRERPNQTHGPI